MSDSSLCLKGAKSKLITSVEIMLVNSAIFLQFHISTFTMLPMFLHALLIYLAKFAKFKRPPYISELSE